jgi:hypothetical protein
MGNGGPTPIRRSQFPIPDSRMVNASIKQGLIVATLVTLAGGCSTWEGPRAKVEDRKVPGVDRSKTVASKTVGGAKDSVRASPQKTANRKATEKPQPDERQATKESTGANAIADAVSSDQVVDMKPDKYPSRPSR